MPTSWVFYAGYCALHFTYVISLNFTMLLTSYVDGETEESTKVYMVLNGQVEGRPKVLSSNG